MITLDDWSFGKSKHLIECFWRRKASRFVLRTLWKLLHTEKSASDLPFCIKRNIVWVKIIGKCWTQMQYDSGLIQQESEVDLSACSYTQKNIFGILLKQPEIRLYLSFSIFKMYLPFSKMVNTIWYRVDWTRFRSRLICVTYERISTEFASQNSLSLRRSLKFFSSLLWSCSLAIDMLVLCIYMLQRSCGTTYSPKSLTRLENLGNP